MRGMLRAAQSGTRGPEGKACGLEQEWEEEDALVLRSTMFALLSRVSCHCQHEDRAFWPFLGSHPVSQRGTGPLDSSLQQGRLEGDSLAADEAGNVMELMVERVPFDRLDYSPEKA